MKKRTFGLIEIMTFIMTPEDTTDRYPDTAFAMHGHGSFRIPKYLEAIKTFFWIIVALLLSIAISQLR